MPVTVATVSVSVSPQSPASRLVTFARAHLLQRGFAVQVFSWRQRPPGNSHHGGLVVLPAPQARGLVVSCAADGARLADFLESLGAGTLRDRIVLPLVAGGEEWRARDTARLLECGLRERGARDIFPSFIATDHQIRITPGWGLTLEPTAHARLFDSLAAFAAHLPAQALPATRPATARGLQGVPAAPALASK